MPLSRFSRLPDSRFYHEASSTELFARAGKAIPGGVNSPVRAFRSVGGSPFFVRRAEGAYLHTVDGRTLIDYVCTWGPAIHGHRPDSVVAAVKAAAEKGLSFGTPHPGEVEMAERLLAAVPSMSKVRLCNSGTEATMSTIRLARGVSGRNRIIKFAGCYHGHVDSLLIKAGSGALTLGSPDSAGIPPGLARETLVLPFNNLSLLEEAFGRFGDELAAVILEPIPANAGLILPDPDFLPALRRLCSDHRVILIFDEVMTGFRLAPGGAQELLGVRPDMSALGKIIGGGLPVGAFGGEASTMDHLAPLGNVYQAGTLSGNPLAVAAGLASIKLLADDPPYDRLDAMGRLLASTLLDAARRKGLPLQVPQIGSMFCLFFTDRPVRNLEDATASTTELYKKFFHACLGHGIYLPPSPFETCFISSAHEGEPIEQTAEIFASVIRAL
ncbi:MAG: glutamate-1-semialdehyde-2,1-aminomutase [Puniceicoccaceae bacterium]|nr:MAG: glutamate-1-semialdehyde-2,1-aminomutase [Puniceicoccaceae bacterium]